MKRRTLYDRGIWTAERYILNVWIVRVLDMKKPS